MICAKCKQPLPTLSIRGVPHRAVKKTHLPKRYIWIGDNDALFIQPVPLLVVEKVRKHAHKHIDRNPNKTAQVPARNHPVRALPKNVQADGRPEVPVLQEKTRQQASKVKPCTNNSPAPPLPGQPLSASWHLSSS